MFLGHFAIGFASKRLAPEVSLGPLMAAPCLLDLLWPVFLLLGWEMVRVDPGNTAVTPLAFDSYPWSHSLLMTLVWAALVAALYTWHRRGSVAAAVLAAGVVSHWVLDALTHRPDMPIAPGLGTRVGLGLWNSVPGTVAVETAMFAAGLLIYLRTTRAKDRVGRVALWAFVGFLGLMYIGALRGMPPPGSERLVAGVDLAAWILPLWAFWFDRHRRIAAADEPAFLTRAPAGPR